MSPRSRLFDRRLLLLVLAALMLAPVFARPTVPASEPVLDYLFVVDITQSMNVRDYAINGQPIDRLNFVKSALIQLVHELPCGSLMGLGVFTGWQTEVLFNPIEVCHHRREIDEVVRYIDWRMAWMPQSNVARGLKDGLTKLGSHEHKASMVFFTDGDEAPDYGQAPAMDRDMRRQTPRGLVVGAGNPRPSPVPLLNQWGRATGYFQQDGATYLSSLEEDYLRNLGRSVGLDYHRLQTAEELLSLLRSKRYAYLRPARQEIGWAFGAGALAFLVAVYIIAPLTPVSRHG